MKRLLRSVIDFDSTVNQDHLTANFQKLRGAHLDWVRPEDQRIYEYCLNYFGQRMELPSIQTVNDYFQGIGNTGDIEAVERLKEIAGATVYVRTNFIHLLHSIQEEQNKVKATLLLKEAQEIITKGIDFREGRKTTRKQGVRDGLTHFSSRALELLQATTDGRTRGSIRDDGQQVWDEYQDAKVNKDKVWGRFSGLNEIDKVCHGIKPGELWVHAGFPGQLKSTLAVNWAYNLATRYKANTVYWSLEMPYEQVRRNFYAVHSSHVKWRLRGYKPLDYRKIRDGELTPEEEEFYKLVVDDFTNNTDYCQIEVMTPDREVTISDIKIETELIHQRMQMGLVVIDHGQLVKAVGNYRDYVIEVNSVVRDAKRLALHFNHGEKVPVLMLFQINRQGYDEAEKNQGRYKPSAIAYANEVEKSSDVITTTFLNDEHRANGTTVICNLKNRDNPKFEPFLARVDFNPRRLYNMDPFAGDGSKGMSLADQQDVLGDML
jgi:replicative DNA helicase